MSTRANIILKTAGSSDVWLYHHWDGYPSCLGHNLMVFLKANGNNANMWYNINTSLANDLIKNKGINDDGYELTHGQHGDIEYLYEVDTDAKTITAYAVEFWERTDGVAPKHELFSARYDSEVGAEEWFKKCAEK